MRRRKPTRPETRSLAGHLASTARAVIVVTPPPLRPRAAAEARPAPGEIRQGSGLLSLRFSTGQTVVVRGEGVVGRYPASDGEVVHSIVIDDPHRLLSRTHFRFGLTGEGGLWVSDEHSGNGTYLDMQRLSPGTRVVAPPGATLHFGDHIATVALGDVEALPAVTNGPDGG
jgi:hypothetical protein